MNIEKDYCFQIGSREVVALKAIEITSIPHISIINSKSEITEAETLLKYKSDINGLLSEIYQVYKNISTYSGVSKDLSIELLWLTKEVANQTFNARIRLIVIIRSIDNNNVSALQSVESVKKLICDSLRLQKYEYTDYDNGALIKDIAGVKDSSVKAIIKEEKAENLNNQLMPYCYSYDILPETDSDMSRIVNTLINYPGCALSIQLMPTVYYQNETAEIDNTTQMLETLSKGIIDQGVGNISFALAEKHAEIYKYYADRKNAPLFSFNILIFGDTDSASNIAGRVYGQIATSRDKQANLKIVDIDPVQVNKNNSFYPLPWAISEILINIGRNTQIWSSGIFRNSLYRLPYILTSDEASELFRLPIGSDRVYAGLPVNESGKDSKTYTDNIINTGDITVGKLRSSANGDTIGFALKDLAKHMLVVGTPGSGKTTFSVSLLDRLWKQHHIPFLVIEPAKNEYRSLVQSIPELQVFTPGKNFISPFVFNPFVPPKNVRLETYKSTLKTAFAAAVSMSTPLDKIFEESINNCYSDFRWLDNYTIDDKGKVFNISDFIKCFQQTFDEIGYTGDAKNIGRAGVVRLNSLVNLFDNYFSIPLEDLLHKPTIIELAAIENSDQKALIISLLLLSILAYVNANYIGEGGLKNVILLEEAHVLLDADTNAGQGDANPSAIAQGLVKRMLAEIRSYGVGLIIADQSPRKVTTDVVALTDMKMVFRLVEGEDKQIIGDSMNMSDEQVKRLAKLKPGEAFLFFNKLDEPEEVITPDYRLDNNISISLSDEGIKQLSTYWNDKQDKLRPYPECDMTPYCQQNCDYNRRILAREIARRIYVRNFKPDSKDFEIVKKVFGQISKLVIAELNDEPFDAQLLSCVKMHLWRRIKYGTKIKLNDKVIENSLKK